MQNICCKLSRVAAMAIVFLVGTSGAWAQAGIPWQVGDIVACYGGGKCNVIRLHGSTVQVLDTISSGLLGSNSGVGLNNTLHVLATDDVGVSGSKVVVYSIASINPFNPAVNPLTHSVISTFDGSGGGNGKAAAVAVNSAGHIFVGNSNPASIVELNADGSSTGNVFTFPTSGTCATTVLNSLDLSAAGDALYVTAGDGVIRNVPIPFSPNSCTEFANFGSLVHLYGIKDIPGSALGGVSPNCNGATCPGGEAILVVAKGFTDPDAQTGESGENSDTDAVNICTGQKDQTLVSCAVLLDIGGAGLNAPLWVANHLYGSAGTNIQDPYGRVQQVLTAGTSGADEPAFGGGITPDNLVIWTNQGQRLWQQTHPYSSGDLVVDPAGHVQQASDGTSATTEPSPWTDSSAPNFGGLTTDGLKWTDQGQRLRNNGQGYLVGDIIVDSAGHVQKALTNGTSGPSAPSFADTPPAGGGTIADGLQWVDVGTSCECSPSPWASGQSYSLGAYIQDAHTGTDIWTVYTPGTSGATEPTFTSPGPIADNAVIWSDQGGWVAATPYIVGSLVGDTNSHLFEATIGGKSGASSPNFLTAEGGSVYDNAVTWTDLGEWQASHAYTQGAQVGDTGRYLWKETNTQGTTGPTAPAFTSSDHPGDTVIDGLQWTAQPNPSLLARYPVSGVTSLQSLALDPLVFKCTGSNGTACSGALPAASQITDSNPLVTPSFWMGGSAGGTIYRLDFANGTPVSFDAQTSNTGIQSIVVYGGESANQPGLASLVVNDGLTSNNTTATASFFQNNIISTLSNNNGSALSGPATPISLYASRVDKTSCFTDPVALNLPCRATDPSDSTKAFVWKLDIPLNGNAALPTTQTLNTAITPPAGTFDNSTDVFVDEQFDDTTFVGGDPGTRTISVHSLHEVAFQFGQGSSQCTYSSPLPNGCYKTNRGTLNFIFTCAGLTQSQFQGLKPVLSLVIKPANQAPQFIPLSGTNGKAPYRFDPLHNFWTFQWSLKGAAVGTYLGTTFDNAGVVQSFPVKFFVKNSCP